jgi:hypothetical protein
MKNNNPATENSKSCRTNLVMMRLEMSEEKLSKFMIEKHNFYSEE